MTEKEFNTCVDLYADRLFRFLLKNIKEENEAQDLVQDSFEALWKQYQKVNFQKARAWLFTTGYRKMIDQIRKQKRITYMDELPETGRINNKGDSDLKTLLENGMKQLSEKQRSLLMLKDYEGYNYKEIGEITGLSSAQVRVYLHRARLKMKAFLVKIEDIL